MKDQPIYHKVSVVWHPEFGRIQVFEDETGEMCFSLEDVARALDITVEEAIEHIKQFTQRTVH